MYRSSVTILAFIGTTLAANSTVQLWLPQNPELNLVGSIVGSDATATTYSVACVTEDCAFPTSFLVTEGPSSMQWTFTYNLYNTDIPVTQALNCQITNSSSGVCSITAEAKTSPYSSSTMLITSFKNPLDVERFITNAAVTLTAGAGGGSTSVAPSTTGSGSSAKESGSSSSTGTSPGSAAAVTGSSSSPGTPSSTSVSSGQGAPVITQAPWVMGAAAVMAYAAM
ncbi:hypothetical protein IFR05_000753 [Cadophora sp. M221]|nr:hypothetical protein IFR05_000753 [Cadophora sp. M221]